MVREGGEGGGGRGERGEGGCQVPGAGIAHVVKVAARVQVALEVPLDPALLI